MSIPQQDIVTGEDYVLQNLNKAKDLAKQNKLTELYYKACLMEARCLQFKNQHEMALQMSREIMKKCSHLKDKTLYVDSLIQVGAMIGFMSSLEEGIKYFDKGHEFLNEITNTKTLISFYKNLGIMYARIENIKEAFQYLTKALFYAETLQDQEQLAAIYSWMANLEFQITNYEACLDYSLKTNRIWLSVKNYLGYAYSQNTAGNVYLKLKDYSKALECLMDADQYATQYGNAFILADIKHNLGLAYHHLNDPEKALEFYNISLEYREKGGNPVHLSNTLNNIGNIYLEQRQYDLAEEYYLKAFEIRKKINLVSKLIDSNNNLCKLYRQLGNLRKAGYCARQSLELLPKCHELNMEMEVYHLMQQYHAEKNEYKKALDYLEKYNQSKEKFINNEKLRNIEMIRSRYESDLIQLDIKEQTEKMKTNTVIDFALTTDKKIAQPFQNLRKDVEKLQLQLKAEGRYDKYFDKIHHALVRIEELQEKFANTTVVRFKKYLDNTKMLDLEDLQNKSEKSEG